MRPSLLPAALLVLAVSCADETPTAGSPEHVHDATAFARGRPNAHQVSAGLARVRAATAAFHDLAHARAAGYTAWSPDPFAAGATCPTNPEGNMGYHLVNVPLRGGAANPAAGDATIDPLHPEMLLFEKRDGEVHLVGVEYIVFQAAWERERGVGASPPTVFGEPLLRSSHPFPGGVGDIPHYELHVWIWSSNPRGMFYPWNPSVSC